MGAPGVMLLSRNHPDIYKNVLSISPVFRPVEKEISETDKDVFRPELSEYFLKNNIGAQLLVDKYLLPENLKIEISNTDFALDESKFP